MVADEAACTLVVQRAGVTVACNFSKDPKSIRFDEEATGKLLIASKRPLSAGEGAIVLPGESVAVFGSGDHANSAVIRSAA